MLNEGDVIPLEGRECIVLHVNDCCARAVPTERARVSFQTGGGKALNFFAARQAFSISPNSEVPVLRRDISLLREFMRKERREETK